MAGSIICPNCKHQFEATDAFREEVQRELNNKAKEWQERKEKEFNQKEQAYQQQLLAKDKELQTTIDAEKKRIEAELQENIRKSIAHEFENKLKLLEQSAIENEEKLKEARKQQLEFLQKERELKTREEELEISIQKTLLQEREKIKEQLQKEEQEKLSLKEQEFQLKTRELEKQIEDQKKLVDEMKRKAEQGSMQLQGEVQELLLEEMLRFAFPFDKIEPVGKGVRGADCIQIVHNKTGQEVGKIIFESKRTKDFSADWIEKIKADMRQLGADIALIVTQALPKDMERFGEKEGIYICTFAEAKSVVLLLRNALLKVAEARKSQENKGDKMVMLYDYLISNEFGEQWKAIREGFMTMKLSIQKERDVMEKIWKSREKQLEKVLLNAAHIRGSIEGIAGSDAISLSLDYDTDGLLGE